MLFSNTLAATAVFALANGAALMSRANSGESTFYGGNTDGGMCSFVGYTIPSGVYGVAMSSSNWENSKACGACIEVTGPKGNKIVALVTDQCPGCGPNHLDLYPDAFAELDNPSKGIIQTSWTYVNCPITTPLTIRNKEGTSPYYFNVQVLNASKRVESLQFSTNGGSSWTTTERQEYNYFLYTSGSGTSSVDVKVTSVDGDVVIVKNVQIGSGVKGVATGNFGAGSSVSVPVAEAVKAPVVEEEAVESPTPVVEAPVAVPTSTSVSIAPIVVDEIPSSLVGPGPVVAVPTPAGAVFIESSTPAVVKPHPTTSASSNTVKAVAVVTPSPVKVEVLESVVTVYVCAASSSTVVPKPVVTVTVKPTHIASTGIVPTPTGQPQFTGAASMNAPALGLIIVGGFALFL